jgi:hypothetical protein
LDFFIQVSGLFRARFQDPLWEKYKAAASDWKAAACLFLEGYAFERQGRSPSYPHAAVQAVEQVADYQCSPDFARKVWKEFEALIREAHRAFDGTPSEAKTNPTGEAKTNRTSEVKTNPDINPLYHKDCNAGAKPCLWCAFSGENIVRAAREALSTDRVKEFWEKRLQGIRGIGPKIASFFLRDVAVRYGLSPTHDRDLLQPVDLWVSRTVRYMARAEGEPLPNDEWAVRRWVVSKCDQPEQANQGIWYFGAQIAQSAVRLLRALEDKDVACELLHEHLESLRRTVDVGREMSICR